MGNLALKRELINTVLVFSFINEPSKKAPHGCIPNCTDTPLPTVTHFKNAISCL